MGSSGARLFHVAWNRANFSKKLMLMPDNFEAYLESCCYYHFFFFFLITLLFSCFPFPCLQKETLGKRGFFSFTTCFGKCLPPLNSTLTVPICILVWDHAANISFFSWYWQFWKFPFNTKTLADNFSACNCGLLLVVASFLPLWCPNVVVELNSPFSNVVSCHN